MGHVMLGMVARFVGSTLAILATQHCMNVTCLLAATCFTTWIFPLFFRRYAAAMFVVSCLKCVRVFVQANQPPV